MLESRSWRSRLFVGAIWALIAALYFFSPFVLVALGWFQEPFSELGAAETVSHRVHEVLFGVVFAQAMVGALSQLARPEARYAGLLQTVASLGGLVGVLAVVGEPGTLSFLFVALALLALVLHPAGPFPHGSRWRPSPLLLGLAAAGALPLVSMFADNVAKAQVQAADHVTHWAGVASFAVVQLLLALIAAARPPGHRVVAASVGLAGIVYLAASLLFPFDASARPGMFAFWLAAWSAAWLLIAFSDLSLRSVLAVVGAVVLVAVAAGFGVSGIVVGMFFATVLVVASRRPAGLPRPVTLGLMVFGLAVLAVGALAASDSLEAPNVPHGLDVSFAAAERSTCLSCHVRGEEGATIVPHEVERACGAGEECWGGRSDCLGCHRYDPDLGGPTVLASMEDRDEASIPHGGSALSRVQTLTASALASRSDD